MFKVLDIEKWNRKTTYEFFKDFEDPFFNMTANLDVTKLYSFVNQNSLSYSLSCLFYSQQTANSIREFKIRLFEDRLVEFEKLDCTQTILQDDESFCFFYLGIEKNVLEFHNANRDSVEKYKKLRTFDVESERLDLIYYSIIPWVSFTSFKHASRFNNTLTVPRIVFGKIFDENERKKMPISVEVNHVIMDGLHVGKYFNLLQETFNAPS
jgi:chloramphenicol O-acetyltransferase type A